MRVLAKGFFRVIGKNKGRFLSVFFIVLLGAGFFFRHPCQPPGYAPFGGRIL